MVAPPDEPNTLRRWAGTFRYGGRALRLVWSTSPRATVVFAGLTVIAGLLPAAVAFVGKLIVDAVVAGDLTRTLEAVAAEGLLVAALAGVQRALMVDESLLRAMLGHRVNVLILEKALALELPHFEDSATYDRMTRARREASVRPLSLVRRNFALAQSGISLVAYGSLLWAFSPVAVLVLAAAAVPAFVAETRFASEAFRIFRWRVPEARAQAYLETVLAREDFAKEVKLFGLGPLLLTRYVAIFDALFGEDRRLALRRGFWGWSVGLLSTAAFYGAYAWIATSAVRGLITLGDMTMYLALFRQGQSALSGGLSAIGGMVEDNLYLSNLYEFLEMPVSPAPTGRTSGPSPGDGLRFEHVSFAYPGATSPAVSDVTLHLRPGAKLAIVGENGSGKTTLIKLMTKLYEPQEGRIVLDGLPLAEWDPVALRRRVAVVFQDFAKYQLLAGENIGAGDPEAFGDEARWKDAAARGLAAPFLEQLPKGYRTRLGRWFDDGRELSGGQWQKVALARAFVRHGADILVLDEPTAAVDAEAEAQIFEYVRNTTKDQMAVLISHRFSTVRMADHIVVLDGGRIVEEGDHDSLVARGGRYAHLFALQAAGYR
jgi:ATP-binding cassette subfamily B protein